jgi:hypothetical protein
MKEGGEHHYLIGVGSRNVFIFRWSSLEDGTGGEKMILNDFEELTLVDSGRPEYLRMGGIHGEEARIWAQSESQEQRKARGRRKRRQLSVLGFESEA